MHKYTPADNHPWRQYKDRYIGELKKEKKKEKINKKRVGVLVKELAKAWDEIEVLTAYDSHREGKYLLKNLPQDRQAGWLISILKMYEKKTYYPN